MAQTDGYGWFRPDPDGRTWRPVREKTPTTSADVSGDLQDGMLAYYREADRVFKANLIAYLKASADEERAWIDREFGKCSD